MGLPKKRTTRSKRDKRRSHHRLHSPTMVECSNCHQVKLAHTACPNCGFYKGRQVIPPREA